MINVIKKKDLDNTYGIFIETNQGSFVFTFCGNLDLYFSYFGEDRLKKEEHSFILTKDDDFLYKAFGDLYTSIVNEKPLENGYDNLDLIYEHKNLSYPLLNNNVIEWRSEDNPYEDPARLLIEKFDDSYKITIKEGMITDLGRTAVIRFKNHDSIYAPYNVTFMNLYNDLCIHDFDNEQNAINGYMSKIKVRKR